MSQDSRAYKNSTNTNNIHHLFLLVHICNILEHKITRETLDFLPMHCPEMDGKSPEIDLPGFRFHPTEEELLDFYLKNMVCGNKMRVDIIGFLNIYHYDPIDLPGLATISGEREWYFFVPRDRKHGSGGRPNRTTDNGFWKATGSDRKILKLSEPKRVIGLRKTLVFYKGRAPKGCKTDWVMNEYRLPDKSPLPKDVVLCKIYRKATSLKVLELRAAQEEATKTFHFQASSSDTNQMILKQENAVKKEEEKQSGGSFSCSLPELQVPKLVTDWNQMDSNWTLFNSPWLQNHTPNFYANMFSV